MFKDWWVGFYLMPITPEEWDSGRVDVSTTIRTKILNFLDDGNAYSCKEILCGLNPQDEYILHREFPGMLNNMAHTLRVMVDDGQLETKSVMLSRGQNQKNVDYYRKPKST